ncbi:PREDICTED: fasciclin-3 isoform X2 [Dinoponera quadriceps]|uniref:Fasciclin-3 isoform X2 n=1 Tax=Dinoponera quadriceps TaxID=609295 RepID=A0A6P3XNV8_DINQU|nr:PREDICTED: fasciclin-3 isoform X2 [Dinoponera quadriceps]
MCTEEATNRRKMMLTTTTTVAWACFLAVLCATTVKAKSTSPEIIIEPHNVTAVRVGNSLQIMCRVPQPILVCRVEIPGEGNAILLSPGQLAEDGIEYYGAGFDKGHCGVRIARVKETHDGLFKCSVATTNSRQEINAGLNIIVAKPPKEIFLKASNLNRGGSAHIKGDQIIVSCYAPNGRPAPNISIYLGNDLLDETQQYEHSIQPTGIKNVTHVLDWKDNGKTIRCVGNHIALDKPLEASMLLDVQFPPQPRTIFERFGYVIGRQGSVNITVYANPKPDFKWKIGDEVIFAGQTDETNRLQTSTAIDMGDGGWGLILSINNVQKSDTEKEYILEARNDLGSESYKLILSTSSEPAGFDLDAGSIIGIVVGVMVLVLIIFLIVFARATGRWCFAARRRGDEETTGDVGAGSEAHITPSDEDEEDHEDPRIIDEKVPQGGQENPIHASTEYVNGRTDIKDAKKDEKTDTPV